MTREAGRAVVLLAIVLVANVGLGGAWMWRNGFFERPIPAEYAVCRVDAVRMLLAAERGVLPAAQAVARYTHHHGPVLPAAAAAAGLVTGDRTVGPVSTWIASCVVFGSLLLLGTWRLATGVGLTPGLAAAAVALTAAAPVVACYQRVFFHQMALAAMVTLAIAEIVRTEGFTRMGASVRAGVLIGLALLAKNVSPIYLAGPMVAELVLKRPAGTGRRALAGAGACVLVALAVATPWAIASWREVAEYARWGTNLDAAMLSAWSPVRWTYHWLACANNGIGLLCALALAALVACRPWLPARGVDLRVPAWQVVASYPVLALLQPIGQSMFILSWMPVLAIVAVELARRALREAPRLGRIAAALLAAGALVNLALAQRGIEADGIGATSSVIELPPRFDWYLGAGLGSLDVVASTKPERWPVAEFAAAIVAAPDDGPPVVAGTHPILCGENILCETLLLGRELRPRPLLSTDPANLPAALAAADYFVHDDLYGDLDRALAWLGGAGIETKIVARLPVVGERRAALVRVLRAPETRPR